MPHAKRAPAELPSDRPRPPSWLTAIEERWPGTGRRATGIAFALLLETGLVLLLLTLGQGGAPLERAGEALATFTAAADKPDSPELPEQERAARAEPEPAAPSVPRAPEAMSEPAPSMAPVAPAFALIPMSKSQMASADIAAVKPPAKAEAVGAAGPPDTGSPGDSQRVAGSGPNGEPLYAARWYREPGEDELRGYLSTASGPGWALINCRTVPDFRVEDCVLEAESPPGADLGRAVLAAAWQFKVRPPRIGGRSMIGEWVRIRIDYEIRRKPAPQTGY